MSNKKAVSRSRLIAACSQPVLPSPKAGGTRARGVAYVDSVDQLLRLLNILVRVKEPYRSAVERGRGRKRGSSVPTAITTLLTYLAETRQLKLADISFEVINRATITAFTAWLHDTKNMLPSTANQRLPRSRPP